MAEGKGLEKGLTNYGDPEFASYLRRSFAKSMGYSGEMLRRPIVGIATSASGFNNCHRLTPELVDAVKRGVLAAGGLPLDFPMISLGEVFLSPTSLVFRNLMSMDVEEMIRAQPMSSVVLVGGCDKTVPAQLMGAISSGVPALQLVVGPMMTGRYHGERLGACTDCRRFWGRYRAGDVSQSEISEVEDNLAVTSGTCAVMGTASTMACLVEALGMSLPDTAAIPAVHADRLRAAEASGTLADRLAAAGTTPREIIDANAIENALRMLLAIGGSTNGVIHLTAIAGRLGLHVDLKQLNALSDSTPVLVNLKPTGQHYMEDFHAAGGVGAVLHELKPLLHLGARSVTGETLEERLSKGQGYVNRDIIRPLNDPFHRHGGLVGLFGTLAPNGSIIKPLRLTRSCSSTRGAPSCSTASICRRARSGPRTSRPTMCWCCRTRVQLSGNARCRALPIPSKLARAGVKDMAFRRPHERHRVGTIVLHISPEAASVDRSDSSARANGPPECEGAEGTFCPRRVDVRRSSARRRRAPARGYARLYAESVLGAESGCDFTPCAMEVG
jgi:dihydroxy-acid dehydratase